MCKLACPLQSLLPLQPLRLNEYECSRNNTADQQGFTKRFKSLPSKWKNYISIRLFRGYRVKSNKLHHTTIKLCLLLIPPMFSPRCTS